MVFGDRGDLAGDRVVFDFERLLDEDAQGRVLDHDVEGEEGAEGVLIGLGDEEGAVDVFVQERGFDFDRADLGGVGAAGAGEREGGLAGQIRLGADDEALGERGVGGEALGEGDDRFLDVGAGQAGGAQDAFVFDVEGEVETGRAGGGPGGRRGGDRRLEASLPQPVVPIGAGGVPLSWVSAKPVTQAGSVRSGAPVARRAPGFCQESTS